MTHLADIFGQEGRLSTCLTNFEPRAGQSAMADAVAAVLSGSSVNEEYERNSKHAFWWLRRRPE